MTDKKPGKAVQKWADESMFRAETSKVNSSGNYTPRARLLDAPTDPLGKLAYIAKAYQGKFPNSYTDISDADRMYYVQDMEKNILGMPSESVMFHFVLENVTRSFTHQLVRTRHASYAQESMRFAVKEDYPVQLPPALIGTLSRENWRAVERSGLAITASQAAGIDPNFKPSGLEWEEYEERYASDRQKMRFKWDEAVSQSSEAYSDLIEMGMPAEDARGLAPHNIVTKLNWVIDLRSLMQVAGQRLCTQAQWEHRLVWDSVIAEIRRFGENKRYNTNEPWRWEHEAIFSDDTLRNPAHPGNYSFEEVGDNDGNLVYQRSSAWQYEFLANRFKPVCYQTGRCQFRSDFDRYCSIRDRVEANASIGRPSSEWHLPLTSKEDPRIDETLLDTRYESENDVSIPPILSHEWLDPNAAIRPDAEWRSEESLNNIKGRR